MTAQLVFMLLLIGFMAGTLSGLVGIGGGLVIVPALIFFLQYTQHQAQGTSLGVLSIPVVILGFLQYYAAGKTNGAPIDLRVIGVIALAFVLGGLLGSRLALVIDEKLLKKIFAVFLFYTAIKLLGWDKSFVHWIKGILG